jgi:hypothetical protein
MASPLQRNTIRKKMLDRCFREQFGGKPVLLDELRWAVFVTENERRGKALTVITRTYRSSFNRTLSAFTELKTRDVAKPNTLGHEVLARAAVFRLPTVQDVSDFLADPETIISITYASMPADHSLSKGREILHKVCTLEWKSSGGPRRYVVRFPIPQPIKDVAEAEDRRKVDVSEAVARWRILSGEEALQRTAEREQGNSRVSSSGQR